MLYYIFSTISYKLLYERVRLTHSLNETFKIKIDQFAGSEQNKHTNNYNNNNKNINNNVARSHNMENAINTTKPDFVAPNKASINSYRNNAR